MGNDKDELFLQDCRDEEQEIIVTDFTTSQLVTRISQFISSDLQEQAIGTSIEDIESVIAESEVITLLSIERPSEISLEAMINSLSKIFIQRKPTSTFRLVLSVVADMDYLVSEGDMKAVLAFFQQLPEATSVSYAMGSNEQLKGRVKMSVVICS